MKKLTWIMLALCTLACGCSEDNEDLPKPDDVKKINGHEYVDLGLSVKWATCNVGADSPEDYGDYFAWGEITPKSEYTGENSISFEKEFGSICGDAKYDAATANWGAPWRLPSKEELDELAEKCTWEWTTQGDHNGLKFTGPNGSSIFLPAAGNRYHTELEYEDRYGYYWSGTPYSWSGSPYYENDSLNAYLLYVSNLRVHGGGRYYGKSVRPVTE